MKIYSLIALCLGVASTASADNISVGNNLIDRTIQISNNHIYTNAMLLSGNDRNYIGDSNEFVFTINDIKYTGLSDWNIISTEQEVSNSGIQTTKIVLEENCTQPAFRATLNYAVYPSLPLIRKWIDFENIGIRDMKIESVNIEDLNTTFDFVNNIVYHNYGRMKHLVKFIGNWDDAVAVVHNFSLRSGIALGNEAVSVLKRTAYHTTESNIEIGLTHSDQTYPFRKWLTPNSKWSTPKTFVCLYDDEDDGFQVINNEVNHFVTNVMGNRIVQIAEKPTFVYNTWNPFRTFVNEELIHDVAKAAADCGVKEFVIDDGWQYNANKISSDKDGGLCYGDWLVDTVKFPKGLKHTFDYVKSLGMKPGLWLTIGSANSDSKVFQDHPEWFIQDANGDVTNLHHRHNKTMFTASFGTEWKNYIRDVIIELVNEYGLEYAKLDFAIATSAYFNIDEHSGSYSTHHPDYRDRPESFIVLFENLLNLFDELHEAAPDLFIDCTFETAGRMQMMDYAIAQHAEGNWLSNFEEPAPYGSLRVRQMAWWRSPAIPASSLVIGNQTMDDPNFDLVLKSMIGTLPIVLGDPRELSTKERKNIRKWADWMDEMQKKYDYMSFRKDLPGYGEPKEGFWDGWQRLNFNTLEGGIFGIFRQGGVDKVRNVILEDLQPKITYQICKAPNGEVVHTATGSDLMSKGFQVTLSEAYDGDIFEVRSNKK